MRNFVCGLGCAALLAAGGMFFPFTASAQQVPTQIQAPANEQLLLQVHAKGDQVYTCKDGVTQLAWTLKAPDARLLDKDGKPLGEHVAGPSWAASDGRRVT